MKYNDLVAKYPVMYYHGFTINEDEEKIEIVYDFETAGLSSFAPSFTLKKPAFAGMMKNVKLFREAAFSLGMVELVSYWKIACPRRVVVECSSLDKEQIKWWKKLYFNGLGEFFYKNEIEANLEAFMDLTSVGHPLDGEPLSGTFTGNLIPVGGGKDSFVSMDLLKEHKDENYTFIIGKVMSAVHSAQAAGYAENQIVNPSRTLDPRMLELNKQGYLNGHTPFSALAAFAAYLTAVVYRRKYIVLSNEASANESTVKGSNVNHQYSKTFEFEQDFNAYVGKYLDPSIHYFSLLRGLSELQIAGIFAQLKQYHAVFRSCNVGSKQEIWCGHCAKCLFVDLMMRAYLPKEEVIAIFGRDMLEDPEMADIFAQLSGISDNKPFECVGTRDEVNIAIAMGIRRYQEAGLELPLLYRQYLTTPYAKAYEGRSVDMTAYNEENLIPPAYDRLVKERMEALR